MGHDRAAMRLRAAEIGVLRCSVCGYTKEAGPYSRCGRCGQTLSACTPRLSAERSLAWLVAALVLYIPANVFPVLSVTGLEGSSDSTILDGIMAFWVDGSWGMAVLIFCASVGVPCFKFVVLGFLILMNFRGSPLARGQRARLHRAVEFIGYWSMLDVIVVALTCRIVSFESLETAEPRVGIVYFCAVVLLTVMSALSFDSRTIWMGSRR